MGKKLVARYERRQRLGKSNQERWAFFVMFDRLGKNHDLAM